MSEAGGFSTSPAIVALASWLVPGGGYFLLTLDRQRANSPSKDDTQAGIKLVFMDSIPTGLKHPEASSLLERDALPAYLAKRRWFSAKAGVSLAFHSRTASWLNTMPRTANISGRSRRLSS